MRVAAASETPQTSSKFGTSRCQPSAVPAPVFGDQGVPDRVRVRRRARRPPGSSGSRETRGSARPDARCRTRSRTRSRSSRCGASRCSPCSALLPAAAHRCASSRARSSSADRNSSLYRNPGGPVWLEKSSAWADQLNAWIPVMARAEDQRVDVVRALVGVDHLEVDQVADRRRTRPRCRCRRACRAPCARCRAPCRRNCASGSR